MTRSASCRYYTGRLLAYDEDYVAAEQHLSFALANCHPSAVNNRRRILRYLIPVSAQKADHCNAVTEPGLH